MMTIQNFPAQADAKMDADNVIAQHALQAARNAADKISPLWPLKQFVAVNPFLGLVDRPFADAA